MKPLKLILFLVLFTALIATGLYFYSNTIIRKSITQAGPAVLKVPVGLKSIDVSPFNGLFSVESLTLGNPEGFESEYALHVGEFKVKLIPTSIIGDTIHFEEIKLHEAIIISDGLRADNHRSIISGLTSKTSPTKEKEKSSTNDQEKPKAASAKKVIIDRFSLSGSQLKVIVDGEEITKVEFPEIELLQIGSKGAAVSALEAVTQIYTTIASETTKVLTVNQDVIEALAKAKLKKYGIKDINDLKDPKKLLKDPDVVNNILGSLLGPKDE